LFFLGGRGRTSPAPPSGSATEGDVVDVGDFFLSRYFFTRSTLKTF